MKHPHVSETAVSDWYAPVDAGADRLQLDHWHLRSESARDASKRNAPPSTMPEVWVARMLRSVGIVIVISEVAAVISDLSFARPVIFYALASDSIGLLIGAVTIAYAAIMSTRSWRPALFAA